MVRSGINDRMDECDEAVPLRWEMYAFHLASILTRTVGTIAGVPFEPRVQ